MSPSPSLLQLTLRAIVLHLVLLLDAALGVRAALLRARLRGLPAEHRRRRPIEAELRRIARVREILSDPDLIEDPRFRGMAAEVARVRNDAGRRALARRRIYPNLFPRLPVARVVATAPHAGPDRCTTTSLSPADRPARAAATWTRA